MSNPELPLGCFVPLLGINLFIINARHIYGHKRALSTIVTNEPLGNVTTK